MKQPAMNESSDYWREQYKRLAGGYLPSAPPDNMVGAGMWAVKCPYCGEAVPQVGPRATADNGSEMKIHMEHKHQAEWAWEMYARNYMEALP